MALTMFDEIIDLVYGQLNSLDYVQKLSPRGRSVKIENRQIHKACDNATRMYSTVHS